MIRDMLSAGYTGYQQNMQRMSEAAVRISNTQTSDLVADAIDLKTAETGVKVNLKVLKIAMDMQGSVLDLLA